MCEGFKYIGVFWKLEAPEFSQANFRKFSLDFLQFISAKPKNWEVRIRQAIFTTAICKVCWYLHEESKYRWVQRMAGNYSTPKDLLELEIWRMCFWLVPLYRFPEERRMASMAPWRELLQNAMQSHKHLKHSTHLQLVCHVFSYWDCLFLWVCYEAWFRYWGVIRFLSLIGPLYLIGVWIGEDQRTNTIKTHHVYKRLDYDFKFYYLPCIQ